MRQEPIKMHGIVLCAGLGTRLRPLTSILPKPAIPVGELPAALRNAEQMFEMGFSLVHCNTHYLAPELERQLKAACLSRSWPVERIRFWHETELLETGGGIARIVQEATTEMGHTDPWDSFVVSGDIVADIPLKKMLGAWQHRKADETTLMVTLPLDKPRKDVTWVNLGRNEVIGFGSDLDEEAARKGNHTARVFSNHQIISGPVLAAAPVTKKSSIDLFYRSSLREGKRILHCGFDPAGTWFDVGTPESYLMCLRKLDLKHDHSAAWANNDFIVYCSDQDYDSSLDQKSVSLPDHDSSSPTLHTQEQTSLIRLSTPEWQWLGSLHSWPEALSEKFFEIVSFVTSYLAGSSDSSARSHLGQSGKRLYLNRHLRSSPSLISAAPLPLRGYLTVLAPDSRLSLPLLVPLSLLLPLFQHHTPHPDNSFWVLVIPRKL